MEQQVCKICKIPLNQDNWLSCFQKQYNYTCKKCDRERLKNSAAAIKLEIIAAYGGKCICCGCDVIEFLSIDHINNDGAAHRQSLSKKGNRKVSAGEFYRWLKRNDFPKDNFQLLCYNCNCSKGFLGYCPHNKY